MKTYDDVAALRSDVSGWVNDSSTNFGWIIRDQTESNVGSSAYKEHGAKQNGTASNRPKLSVSYTAPFDSYDSGCSTITDSCSGSTNVVCVKANGTFSTGTTYKVRLYDGNGNVVTSFTQDNVASSTLSSGLTYTLTTDPSAASGTWHAVVFENSATPPSAYTSIDESSAGEQQTNLVAADDTFSVASSAIPELPTPVGAEASALTVAAVYYWMQRRVEHDVV